MLFDTDQGTQPGKCFPAQGVFAPEEIIADARNDDADGRSEQKGAQAFRGYPPAQQNAKNTAGQQGQKIQHMILVVFHQFAIPEIMAEQYDRTAYIVDEEQGDERCQNDAHDTHGSAQNDIEDHIGECFCKSNISALPPEPCAFVVDPPHVTGFQQVKIQAQAQDRRAVKQHVLSRPEGHKRLVQAQQANGSPAANPGVEEIKPAHVTVILFRRFGYQGVAYAGNHGLSQDVADRDQDCHDQKVIAVDACHGQADESGYADDVKAVAADGEQTVQKEDGHSFAKIVFLRLVQIAVRDVFGEFPADTYGKQDVSCHSQHGHGYKIPIERAGKKQQRDLQQRFCHQENNIPPVQKVQPLCGGRNGGHVPKAKIADHRIGEKNQVAERQVDPAGQHSVLNQMGQ